MPSIDSQVMSHKLNIYPDSKSVKQRKTMYGAEKREATRLEVEKLMEAKFIKEVPYLEWLANPVLIKKSNGKYQMYIDFVDLNQAYYKDCYHLPNINKLINTMTGFEYLSSFDAMSSYHQIYMHKENKEKTSFITEDGTYYY